MLLEPVAIGLAGLISAVAAEKLPWVEVDPLRGRRRQVAYWYMGFTLLGIALGVLASGARLNVPMWVGTFALLFTGALDLRYRLVFPAVVVVFAAGILVSWAITDEVGLVSAAVGALVSGFVLLLLYLLASLMYGFGALGSGDIFVGVLIGAALGWPLAIVGISCGALAGGIWAVWELIRGAGRRGYIAYGAALCFASALVLAGKWVIGLLPGVNRWLTQLELLTLLLK